MIVIIRQSSTTAKVEKQPAPPPPLPQSQKAPVSRLLVFEEERRVATPQIVQEERDSAGPSSSFEFENNSLKV